MKSLMIDIETLATGADAAILTIAAVKFDPLVRNSNSDELYLRVTLESQDARRIDDKTIEWWATQSEAVREDAFSEHDRVDLATALEQLRKLAWHSDKIWMQGPTFDAVILEHAFREHDMALPWSFWQIRDSRTLLALTPHIKRTAVNHNALDDCKGQIDAIQRALSYLGVERLS